VCSFQIACGTCRFCKKKLSSVCENTNDSKLEKTMYGSRTAGMMGYSHLTGGFAGGQADYVRIPYGDVNLQVIPPEVSDEKALYLSDVLCTSYHCVVDTGVEEGDTVAVWGVGAVGILACKWAFLKGASRVIAIDTPERLKLLKERIPNVETLDYTKCSKGVSVAVRELVPGGVDAALECAAGEYAKSFAHKAQIALGLETDTPELLNEMILSVRAFGRVGITGVYAAFTNGLNIGAVMEKGVRLIGNGQAPTHLHRDTILKDYIMTGKIDPLMVMMHRFKLEDVPAVYKMMDTHKDDILKTFIETKFSNPPSAGAPKLSSPKI